MDQETFETRYCDALDLVQRGQSRRALREIEHILKVIGEIPATQSERTWRLMCRNEKANLLYRLGREDEAQKLVAELVKT